MLSKNARKVALLRKKLYFTIADVAQMLEISLPSAAVACSRYVRHGDFLRLKNGCYVFAYEWEHYTQQQQYAIANMLQTPSYISLLTALSLYEVSTQVQRAYIESVCIKRTRTYTVGDTTFRFYKIAEAYYGDFIRKDDIFIATKEKALLDALYLYSFGKYSIDVAALDMQRFDMKKLAVMLRQYPEKTKKVVKTLCKI